MKGTLIILIVSLQVGGAVVIYEVQRNASSEARKEEARRQELEVAFEAPSSSPHRIFSWKPNSLKFYCGLQQNVKSS
jgi:hypothetical protein